ncbi:hypothetical protein [Streptomyces sp. NPDC127038]|uniref:hypothetical protein n=1 Tax=Streptomyces sp. NPDC127038 TaxID=3347114 RepID=UPI00364997D9
MSRTPGPDERRVQHWLRRHGVGPDAHGDLMATDDWWNDLYDETDTKADDEQEEQQRGPVFAPVPDYYPRPHMPAVFTAVPDRAAAAVSPKTRRALYNASAAGAGWGLGLYQQCAHALADCGRQYSVSGALVLGVGGCVVVAHFWDRRTRHWWPGIAWAARIPLATAILALALWAPAAS